MDLFSKINKLVEKANENDDKIRRFFDELHESGFTNSLLEKYVSDTKPLEPVHVSKTCENEQTNQQ